MQAVKIVRVHVRVDAIEAAEAAHTIQIVIRAARDLKLLTNERLELMFDKTLEGMSRDDVEVLATVAKQLESILSKEAHKRS